jgi:hypothetical protein
MSTNPLPERFQDMIEQQKYDFLIEVSTQQIRKIYNVAEIRVRDGGLAFDVGDQKVGQFFLDNLIDRIKDVLPEKWPTIIEDYFVRLQDRSDAYDYFFKDLDYSKQFLKLVIKPDSMNTSFEDFVTWVDFEGTHTCLVFDFQDQLYYIHKDKADLWQVKHSSLMQMGLDNLMAEKIEVKEIVLGEKTHVYCFFSGDFSSAYLLNLYRNFHIPIGPLGALVSIASKSFSMVLPLQSSEDLVVLPHMMGMAAEFAKQNGGISNSPYWFDGKKFQIFGLRKDEKNNWGIEIPNELLEKIYSQR